SNFSSRQCQAGYLHSFPTRRSSDLPAKIEWAATLAPTITGEIKGTSGFANSGQWLAISSQSKYKEEAWKFLSFMYSDETLQAYQDRKSTRLNSSHVKISYAVFCLKK